MVRIGPHPPQGKHPGLIVTLVPKPGLAGNRRGTLVSRSPEEAEGRR
jgi:hypothetical protein